MVLGARESAALLGFGLSAFLLVSPDEGQLSRALRPACFLAATLLLIYLLQSILRIRFDYAPSPAVMTAAGLALGALALCAGFLYLGAQLAGHSGNGPLAAMFSSVNAGILRNPSASMAARELLMLFCLQLNLSLRAALPPFHSQGMGKD